MKLLRCLQVVLVSCALVLLVGCSATGEDRELPVATLEVLGGGEFDLQETGQPRALNLWATWCAPCRAELPAFDAVADSVNGVDIVGINTGDAGPDASELVDELGLTFQQVLDPKASVQRAMRITGMPATIFVDAGGEVVEVHSGELDQSELEELLADHFGATFDS